jgi:putative transposase
MIQALKESYPVKTLCEAFGTHRSSYKYWRKRSRTIKPQRLMELALVRSIFAESNGSAGARSIATIATDRGTALSRYRAGRLMKQCQRIVASNPSMLTKRPHKNMWRFQTISIETLMLLHPTRYGAVMLPISGLANDGHI